MNQFSYLFLLFLLLGQVAVPLHGAGSTSKKKQPPKKSALEEVNGDVLRDVLDDNDQVLVLFYEDDKTPSSQKLVKTLEKLDLSDIPDVPFVRISDLAEAEEFGISFNDLPQMVLFQNSIPDEYDGDLLDVKTLKKWVKEELESTDVDVLDIPTMEKVVSGGSPFLIMFVDDPKRELNSESAVLKVSTYSYRNLHE